MEQLNLPIPEVPTGTERPAETSADEWPAARCKRGKTYLGGTPYQNEDGSPHMIVIMDERDWNDFGTRLEALRQVAIAQDSRIKELLAEIAQRDLQVADAKDRLNALRDVRRAEKRRDIEGELIVLGDSRFSTNRK